MNGTAEADERRWAAFCHLAAFCGVLIPFFGNVIGPMVLWVLKREEYPLVNEQGRNAVNFQLSMTIYGLCSLPFCLIAIGFAALFILVVVNIVCVIKAAVAASNGQPWEYPITLELIK